MFEQFDFLPPHLLHNLVGETVPKFTAYRYFCIILPRSVILRTTRGFSRFENGRDTSRPQERRNRRTLITITLSPSAFYLMLTAPKNRRSETLLRHRWQNEISHVGGNTTSTFSRSLRGSKHSSEKSLVRNTCIRMIHEIWFYNLAIGQMFL